MRHENFDDFQWQAVPPAMWEMEWEVETKKKTGGDFLGHHTIATIGHGLQNTEIAFFVLKKKWFSRIHSQQIGDNHWRLSQSIIWGWHSFSIMFGIPPMGLSKNTDHPRIQW